MVSATQLDLLSGLILSSPVRRPGVGSLAARPGPHCP